MWQLPFIVSLYLVAVYRLSPCPRSLHFAIWSTMGNLTTHGWLTALHHQLIDRAVSLPLLLTKPKWCRTNLTSFLTGSLSFSSISHVLIFYLPCSLNVLMDMRATACCEITPVGWPIRDWISQPTPLSSSVTFLHSSTLIHSVLHNFHWFRLLSIEANVSSMWFKWVLFLCILGFLLYFNLCNRRVRLVALLWVHLISFFIYLLSVFIF